MACTGCMDDAGYTAGEGIRTAAIAATEGVKAAFAADIAKSNYDEMVSSYRRLHEIAQRSLDLAERQQGRLSSTFWPRETSMLSEFGWEDQSIESAEVLGSRYAGRLMASVTSAFAKQLHQLKCNSNRYCTSAYNKARQDLLLARAAAQTNAKILGRSIGYAEHQARVDTNWNRRMQMAAMGRGLLDNAARLTEAAAGGVASVAGQQAGFFADSLRTFDRNFRSAIDAFKDVRDARKGSGDRQSPFDSGNSYGVLRSDTGSSRVVKRPSGWGLPQNPWVGKDGSLGEFLKSKARTEEGYHKTGDYVSTPERYPRTNPELFADHQRDNQMNIARMGNQNLVRSGKLELAVKGAPGTVTIDMNEFGVDFVDQHEQQKAQGGVDATVIEPLSDPSVKT